MAKHKTNSSICVCFLVLFLFAQALPRVAIAAGEYARIDRHAMMAPKSAAKNLRTLSSYLIKPAKNDREKVRSIYTWISKNISFYYSEALLSTMDASARGVLARRRANCSGFSHLFKKLAELSGLQARAIDGLVKGYGYKMGDQIKQRSARDIVREYYEKGLHRRKNKGVTVLSLGRYSHAWNAVKLAGRWQLLDVGWGAEKYYCCPDAKGRMRHINTKRAYSEHYFLTPPEQLIYDHFPTDKKWQLQNRAVSLKKFQQMPFLRPEFFLYGMQLKSHRQGIIKLRRPTVVSLRVPPGVAVLSTLTDHRTGKEVRIKSRPPANGLQTIARSRRQGDNFEIHLSAPKRKKYFLKIYAKKGPRGGRYRMAAEYLLTR
jgi:transglutaminase/protease-like cytokinesis protein 3